MDKTFQAIQILNKLNNQNYEFCIYGEVNSEQDYIENVKFISGRNENNGAIFSETQPYSWTQIQAQFTTAEFNLAIEDLRVTRNILLAQSDWTQFNDSPLTDAKKTEWATYRTSLRNLTNGLTTVAEVRAVTWPTKPV